MIFAGPGGMRTSTVLLAGAFVLVGFRRGLGWRAWLACALWLVTFECAWQWTTFIVHGTLPPTRAVTFVLAIAAPVAVVVARRAGLRADRLWALVTAYCWLIWLLSGFHSNGHSSAGLDVASELLNETAKTAWGVTLLWPLLPLEELRRRLAWAR